MKDRPILFSAPMVRALLDGRKTQTRRISKHPQLLAFLNDHESMNEVLDNYRLSLDYCPYGQPGDLLWVKETWGEVFGGKYAYRANPADDYQWGAGKPAQGGFRWKSPRFMPRVVSRLTLEIADVRVERLQDISEEDVWKEGLRGLSKDGTHFKWGLTDSDGLPGNDDSGWAWAEWMPKPQAAYRTLWESINGDGSWDTNPWVWVIEFKVIHKNIDEVMKCGF